MLLDPRLRRLTLASAGLSIVAAWSSSSPRGSTPFQHTLAIVLWGLSFGGSATQLQTAAGAATGEHADAAISIGRPQPFNLAILSKPAR